MGVVSAVLVAIVLFIVIGVALFMVVGIYNRLIAYKNAAKMSWSNVHVLLKQRHDELPKLVEVCKQYMKYEQETLARVIDARGAVFAANEAGNVRQLGLAETELRTQVGKLFAVAEAYPALKTNEQFMNLQARITSLENGIADRREFYNESVNINNVRIEQFPDSIVAALFSFRPMQLLKFSSQETGDVDVRQLFQA